MVTPEEIEAAQPESSRTVDIEQFVELAEIDPIFYDSTYYLAPGSDKGGAAKAYSLLYRAMEQQGKVGIGRVVMRTKEYLAALRPLDGVLAMSTMLFAGEPRWSTCWPPWKKVSPPRRRVGPGRCGSRRPPLIARFGPSSRR